MADDAVLQALQDILAAAESLYPATDPAAPVIPERRYYHVGLPADDLGPEAPCRSSLVAYAMRVLRGQPGAPQATPLRPSSGLTNQLEAHVRVIRCVPVFAQSPRGAPPTPTDIETAHADLLYDARIIWHGLWEKFRSKELLSDCVLASFGPMVAVSPLGGAAGWDLSLGIDFS